MENKNYSGIGSLLVLIGGILAIIFAFGRMFFTFLLRRALIARGAQFLSGRARFSGFMATHFARGFLGLMFIGAIVAIIVGILAIIGYMKIKGRSMKNGALIAIIAAIIMLVTTNWIPGIITLIGGIICYASEPTSQHS